MDSASFGPWRLGAVVASSPRYEYRSVESDLAHGDLVAKVAKDPRAAAALAVEKRRIASLRDRAPEALPALVDAIPSPEGCTALVYARVRGAPLTPLDEPRALAVTASLARLANALAERDLAVELSAQNVFVDGERVALTGLSRIRPAAGQDPTLHIVALGEVLARALGATRAPTGWVLEKAIERRIARPSTAVLARKLLRGERDGLARLLELAGPEPAAPRSGTFTQTIHGPHGFAYHLLGEAEPDDGGVSSLVAACARTGALVVLKTLAAGTGRSNEPSTRARFSSAPERHLVADAIRRARDKVETDFDHARVERSGRVPLVRFRAPAIDPHLSAALAPEFRQEVYAVYAWGSHVKPVALPPLPAVSSFTISQEKGKLRFHVEGAEKVAIVSAGAATALLVPEDGEPATDLPPSEPRRFAAFPIGGDEPGMPRYAHLEHAVELEKVEATPGIGKVAFSWSPPPEDARAVVVRVGDTEPATPIDGALAYWGTKRQRIEVPGEPGKVLHARAFLLEEDGTFTRGKPASAEAWPAPSPVVGLAALAVGERAVKLTWSWPEDRKRLSGAVLRRDPAFPQVAIPLEATSFDDKDVPPGVTVRYELATLSAGEEAKAEVATIAWAELAAFRAEGAGEGASLSWTLPAGAPADAAIRVIRRLDRAPADLDDGDPVSVVPGTVEHMDGPLPAGTTAYYKAGLVFAGGLARSPGLAAAATALEKAGQLAFLQVQPKRRALEVRWEEPPANVDDSVLYAGREGRDLVAYDRAAFLSGKPVRLDAKPGVPQRVRVVPRFRGREDPSGAVAALAVAWDEIEDVVARPAPGAVVLSWAPAPEGAEVVVRRKLEAKDASWEELGVPAGSTSFKDDPPRGKNCIYKVSLRFRAGEVVIESEGVEKKEKARDLPPELGEPAPRLRVAPGVLALVYFEPKVRLNYTGVVVLESPRSPAELAASFKKVLGEREYHTPDDLPAIGADLVEVAAKDASPTPKVEVSFDAKTDVPRGTTFVVSTRNGPIRRVNKILRGLKLPPGVLVPKASVDEATGKPKLDWTLPASGGAKLVGLEVRRSYGEGDAQDVTAKDRERLEAPFSATLSETSTSFLDQKAEDAVTWNYLLVATFDDAGDRFEVTSAPATVRGGLPGGKLLFTATQVRGFFGFKRPTTVEIAVRREGGTGPIAAFQVVRSLEGQRGEAVVGGFEGGEAPPPIVDAGLSAFAAGMVIVYAVKLMRGLDARRVEVGMPVKVTLG